YRSDVWESFWDGYEPEGPDDQLFLKAVPPEGLRSYRSLVHSMWALDHQGVDYVARTISRCRLRGVSPWVSLRMNDVHFNDNMQHPFHPDFWRDSKRWRDGSMGYYQRALDYGQPEVRGMYRKLIVETLERYDIDGLELDFMREPYLFREGQEQSGGEILTQFLREVRKLVDETAAKRGHPIALGVRVPSRVVVAQAWGLDAVAWAKEKLVDLVVVTPRWGTLEYDMPIAEWKKLLEPTGATLAGGLEILCRPMPASPAVFVTPAQAAGAATAVLSGGADAAYLFNYFPSIIGGRGWSRETYVKTLGAMNSLPTVAALPREHVVTWRDIVGPHEQYTPPLPVSGTTLAFALPTGPAPSPGAKVTLEISLEQGATEAPTVAVNGSVAEYVGRHGEKPVVLEYHVPPATLTAAGRASIEVKSAAEATVVGVSLSITP
ncbi:MAG: family 10 glycosylhydrolase, partial [Bacteroidota bacterium]